MAQSLFPSKDAELLAWSLNFSTLITATPTAYGLTAALATAYTTVHTNFATALAACDPGQRNRTATQAKNAARSTLKTQARLLANLVNGTASVTDAQKIELGVPPRALPTPQPAPTTPPTLAINVVSGWTVTLRLSDSTDSARRGKPENTIGASIFSYVGATPPTDISEWKFEGNTGRVRQNVIFADTLAPGTKVWLTAFWFNGRKQSGPACSPVSTYLQGGSVALAA